MEKQLMLVIEEITSIRARLVRAELEPEEARKRALEAATQLLTPYGGKTVLA